MVRRSIVRKLWLTIVGLVLVVLLILALYLEQFFASYVTTMQQRDLTSQAILVSQLLQREPNEVLALQIGAHVMTALHSHYYLVAPPAKDPAVARLLAQLPLQQRSQLEAGRPVIAQGLPSFITAPDPETKQYALMPVVSPAGVWQAFLVITESSTVTGDPARAVTSLIIFAVVLGTLLTTGLAFVLSKNLTRPLVEMNEAAEEMAKGRFDMRVRVVTQDEVGRLGQTFNHVAAELEKTVHQLTQEKEEIAGVLGAMTDAVVATDVRGRLTLLNPAAEQRLRDDQLLRRESGRPYELPAQLVQMQTETLAARRTTVMEFKWRGRDVVASMTPLYEPDNLAVLRGTLAVVRDITEERRLDRLQKDFVANVSHELRTPLSLFQGYAEALLDEFGDDPETRREMTQLILDESLRMRRLVNDLLDLAQMESGHFSMRSEVVNLAPILQKVSRKFQTLFHERGLRLAVRTDGEELMIEGDADRIEQILTNLVDNALRHTTSGGVTLSAGPTGDHVMVRVADTGEGITAEDVPFVFERFYKADKARTRARGGTGLGLAIVRSLIRAHGGDISVESELGHGTVFSILLPLYKPSQDA